MLATIYEVLAAICVIMGAAVFDSNVTLSIIFIIGLVVFLLLAKHEGGFREYEEIVDNDDVDALLHKYYRSRRRAGTKRSSRHNLL